MPDLYAEWNDDLQVSATGDLLLADGDDMARQRIIRRLLTAVKGYVFHLEYGAGLPQQIGENPNVSRIESIVRSQLMLESAVSRIPPAKISVTNDPNNPGLRVIGICYRDAATGETVSFSLSV